MKMFDVQMALEGIREAKAAWTRGSMKFKSDVDFVMTRLLHEAAINFMSVAQVSEMSGMTPKQVRELMRRAGLDPKTGKRLLSKQAAEALASNSALMGIEPHEMDLTSPLAYLPMGSELKQQLIDARVSRVTELPDEARGYKCNACRLNGTVHPAWVCANCGSVEEGNLPKLQEFPETDLTAEEFEAVETAAFMYGTTNSDLITLINALLANRARRAQA